jgi:hypothetical protein
MRISRRALLFFGCCALVLGSRALNGDEALQMQVSPAVQLAPATLNVRVRIESSPENRLLKVVAESTTFYRSSEVQIDGANASPLRVFQFRGLPKGRYDVTSVLVGTNGRRAMVSRVAQVVSSPGER